jgi:hypothetical protein
MKSPFLFIVGFVTIALLSACCKDEDNPDPSDCICYEIYAPVCGEDGIVYANDCYAECAGVEYTEGFCPETRDGKIINSGPVAADGCGWLIEVPIQDTIIHYSPINLSVDFQVDDLQVILTYKRLLSQLRCGIAASTYPEIEIIEIEEK